MANEIELKLRIRAVDLPRLRQHPAVKQALVGQPVTRRLTSIYYDTPKLALLDADLSLRVRRMAGGWFQAVKGAGHSLAGLHQRMEWEDIIARGEPDFSKITDPALTQVFDNPELRAALRPIFTTDVRRTEWQLRPHANCEIEMALDVGNLIVGDHKEPICEVELELKTGEPVRLFAFALTLLEDIPLWIENISKAQRGYAHYRPQPHAIRHAKAVRLKHRMAPAEACRSILWECLSHMQGNHDVVASTRDSEGVHQMRVALRRMRSAMTAFAAFMPPAEPLTSELRWLAGVLGKARDLDVFIEGSLPILQAQLPHPGLLTLEKRARKAVKTAYEEVVAALESQRYQRLLLQLGVWMEHAAPGMQGVSLDQFARELLARRHRQLCNRGKHWQTMTIEERHQLRIAAKKLRYACEFFTGLYPEGQCRVLLRRLNRLLNGLGRLNDLAALHSLIEQLNGTRPSRVGQEAAWLIAGWQAASASAQLSTLKPAWKRFAQTKPFWA